MAAKSKSTRKKAEPNEVERLMDLIIENQGRVNKALASARKRGVKITEMVSEQMMQGQREALELTKMMATNPTAYSENAKAMMDAAAEAQSRAMDFAKEIYNEQVEAAESLRDSMQTMMESSREAAEAAMEMSRTWNANNPLAEAWQQGMEALRTS